MISFFSPLPSSSVGLPWGSCCHTEHRVFRPTGGHLAPGDRHRARSQTSSWQRAPEASFGRGQQWPEPPSPVVQRLKERPLGMEGGTEESRARLDGTGHGQDPQPGWSESPAPGLSSSGARHATVSQGPHVPNGATLPGQPEQAAQLPFPVCQMATIIPPISGRVAWARGL